MVHYQRCAACYNPAHVLEGAPADSLELTDTRLVSAMAKGAVPLHIELYKWLPIATAASCVLLREVVV